MLDRTTLFCWAEADMLKCTVDNYTCVYAADTSRQPTKNATSCAFLLQQRVGQTDVTLHIGYAQFWHVSSL